MQQEVSYTVPSVHLPFPYLCWRKGLDITFALVSLLVMLVLLPLVALLIYVDSPGPIFYKQERVGYRGKKFWMHKFRSMTIHAEGSGNAIWASKSDPRVTRIGRFLRATHLDELPQAVNILRGEMCLIGPRPEREEYVLQLEKASPVYRDRLLVKPGLTGWSQVNYGYGSTSKDELTKLQYDLYYIKHQSFRLDMLILLKTVGEVVLCHGI
jgi:lipopolysaccharide/colanic/teichoic acid biosynthesis glycosyltransferase